MKKKWLKKLSLVVSLFVVLTSSIGTTLGLIVTGTDSIINTFSPFESVLNHILISKSVEHPFDEDYIIPDSIAFDFKVELGNLYANTTIQTSNGEVVADENGNIIVPVKPGKSVSIKNIDVGTEVSVTELETSHDGFSVKDGIDTKEMVVLEDRVVNAEFINVYTPLKVQANTISVQGQKRLHGREWKDSDVFSFVLEQEVNGNWNSLSTKTVSNRANTFSFDDCMHSLTFDKVGTYHFRMREIQGNDENIEYDSTVYQFSIHISDVDMDGKLEINKVNGNQGVNVEEINGEYQISVNFNNTFIPDPEDITVAFTIEKNVKNTGVKTITPEGFKFVLENKETHSKTMAISNQLGKAMFERDYSVEDIGKTYTYKLYEVIEEKEGITYDEHVYEIEVSIVKEQNTLKPIMKVNGIAVDEINVSFENIYHAEVKGPPTGDSSNRVYWLVLLMLSGIVVILNKKQKRMSE